MPKFITLTTEDVIQMRKERRMTDLSQQHNFLKNFSPGEVGELILNPDESKRTEKRRLAIAATSMGLNLHWIRLNSGKNLFILK